MARLQWQPAFETGIAEVDEQHRKFISLINRLEDCISDRKPSDECGIPAVLADLVNYAHYHFAFEEKLQENIDFSERTHHLERHTEILNWLNIQSDRLQSYDSSAAKDLLNHLMDWFLNHTLLEDKRFGREYLRLNRESREAAAVT
jgi:hemerythrin-like metal-binding protein